MENEEDEPAGGDSGAAGEGEGGIGQAQAEEAAAGGASAAAGEHEGGAGHAQTEPADQEDEGGGLHGGEALAEARGHKRGLPEGF